jgi:hypothetical protein
MGRRRLAPAAALAVVALVLTGCGSGTSSTAGKPTEPPTTAPSTAPSTPTAPTTTTGTPTPSGPTGGPSTSPAPVTPRTSLLDWQAVNGSTKDQVTVGGAWTLTVVNGGGSAVLSGPSKRTISAGAHSSISDALMDSGWAVVVSEDTRAETPDVATVVDLSNGKVTTLDQKSDPPTSVGGTWALGQGRLVHATVGAAGAYCLASVDLASGQGTSGYCAPKRHGFSRAAITNAGETLMTFDAQQPSCRTLMTVDGADLTPLPGVTACKGWDSAALDGGAIWSVVPKNSHVEAAHFYARTGDPGDDGWFDLGRGTSGTLVVCGDAAYFARDPASNSDPASLMRWTPDGTLSTVFESTGHGKAFLSAPRCGSGHLTVNAYAAAGDQQVTAAVS